MTDEQRKQFIEEQIEIFPADCDMGEFLRDMAKLQPCGDAISRQAVIDATTKYCVLYDLRELLADIETLPSINVAEKTGRWIKSRDSYGNNHFTCPFCEHDIATKYADTWDNYCSNCGAKMEVEE